MLDEDLAQPALGLDRQQVMDQTVISGVEESMSDIIPLIRRLDMSNGIPEPILEHVRKVFRTVNQRVSRAMSLQPNVHEPSLDMLLIGTITELGEATRVFKNGEWVVTIEAEFFGGFRMYEKWEVADIGIFVTFRRRSTGDVVKVKSGLLQSKRLFADEDRQQNTDDFTTMGKLLPKLIYPSEAYTRGDRTFTFGSNSRYRSLKINDEQAKAIRGFQQKSPVPVFYLLYHPYTVPFSATVPTLGPVRVKGAPPVGARVIPADAVLTGLQLEGDGSSPTYEDMQTAFQSCSLTEDLRKSIDSQGPGWRLETWIADLLLGCRLGFVGQSFQDNGFEGLLASRTRPISSALSVTIDVPDSAILFR